MWLKTFLNFPLMIKWTSFCDAETVILSKEQTLAKVIILTTVPVPVLSVSDPHTLNADPDPGLWLNTYSGSQYFKKQKKI